MERHVLPTFPDRLTWRAVTVLRLVHSGATDNVATIVAITGIPRSTLSALVESLVQSGYLLRSTHPRDRRIVRVALAARRRRVVNRMVAQVVAEEQRLLASLEPALLARTADDLRSIVEHLNASLR
jgi:DNA-binding MarR family transcriptional regulator